MTVDFDRLLRDTVHELAAEGRPGDLTAPALRRARRIRTRRTVSAVASVVVLLAGIGVAAVQLRGDGRGVPPAERSPSASASGSTAAPAPTESLAPGSAPVSVAGGWLIRAAPAPLGAVTYDDRAGRYRLLPVDGRVAPSPNGQFIAQVTANGDVVLKRTDDDREITRRANSVRNDAEYPVWAPDSSRLAFMIPVGTGTVRVVAMNVDGTEQLSANTVSCPATCTVKWLENGQRLRVYTGSNRVEVTVATGAVGAPSATPDDPCGYRFAGYHIDSRSWLCVTANGFAVTTPEGAVTQRVPFPSSIDGIGVEGNVNGYVLYRPK